MESMQITYRTGRRPDVVLAGVLGWVLTLAGLLVIERGWLEQAMRTSRSGAQWHQSDVVTVAFIVAAPVVAGLAVALLFRMLLYVARTALYLRAIHAYAGRYLELHDALRRFNLAPGVVRFTSEGEPTGVGSEPFTQVVDAHARVLLLGESGTGKTVALHAVAYELSRRRWLIACLLGRRPLPVLLSLPGYAEAMSGTRESRPRTGYIAAQIARLSTAGFGRSSVAALRAGRLMLLCDDLHAAPVEARSPLCAEVADLSVAGQQPIRTIVACDLQTYSHAPQTFAPLRSFQRVVLADIPQSKAVATTQRAMRASTRSKQANLALGGHRLETALTTPALLAALLALLESGWDLPYGRGPLLIEYLTLLCERATRLESDVDGGRLSMMLGELAGSIREAERPSVALTAGAAPGAAVAEWLAHHPPIAVNDHRSTTLDPYPPAEAETLCRAAIKAGILDISSDGTALQFAHRLLEAGFAAWWLQQDDDGLGRIQPGLLRLRWALPVIVWSDSAKDPADVAKRLLRLADTPDGSAIRAGLPSGASVYPAALALAVAAATESFANALAQPGDTPRLTQRMRDLTQQHLRDMLDQAQIYMSQGDHQARIARALQEVEEATGPEFAQSIAYLIRQPEFNRLLRAQLVELLGLLASPPALEILVGLLGEMDPVLRQATEQAFRLAGGAALGPLQAALAGENETIRVRAGEVLAGLGEIAIEDALAGLASALPAQRIASARTLGLLKTTQAVEALIARLADEDSAVRAAAAHALGAIGGTPALDALLQAARSPDPTVRAAVANALNSHRDDRAIPVLLDLLADREAEVRTAAADALGRLGDERAVEALRARREDPDPWTQHAAVAALRRMGRR